MIKRSLNIIGALAIGALVLSGCTLAKMIKMAQEQKLTVTPNPVELHADSVRFEVSALLPVKMLKKNYLYNVEAIYKYGDQSEKLGMIQFRYEDFANAPETQPLVKKTFAFGYTSAKERGSVVALCSAAKVTGKFKSAPEFPMAEGVITTSLLVKDENYVAYADHGYNNKEELVPTNVEFFFDIASSKLKTTQISGGEGKKMSAFIAAKNVTRTVNLMGMHSPEGSQEINSKLAKGRPDAIEAHYRKMMKKYDYKNMADSIKFVVTPVVQDWTSFKAAVASTTELTDAQKSEVNQTISGPGSFIDQEKALRKLSYYNVLKKKVYPPLRTAKTEILSVKLKKTDAQISALAAQLVKGDSLTDTLNAQELGYSATLTPELAEKEKIYAALIKKTESAYAYNNLAAVYLEMAKKITGSGRNEFVSKAKTNLEIAVKKEGIAEAHNNLAVVYTMENNKIKALEHFLAAIKKGTDAETMKGIRSNLGSAQIKHGKYEEAIRNLGGSTLSDISKFNLGLAQLLLRDYETAKRNLSSVQNDAIAAYCTAIACARVSDNEGTFANLKTAISLNSALREKAIKDLEFKKLADNAGFLNAVK